MSEQQAANRFKALAEREGRPYWFLGTLVYIRASAADTNGAFTMIEQLAPVGFGPPLHVHHVEEELFFVLEGVVRFRCGEREVTVAAGGTVTLPKGVPHAFRVEGATPARLLQVTSPGGFDRFVEEIGLVAPQETLPPPGPPPPGTVEAVAALGAKYHFSVVGPPL
jgi:mannose-6-phosphate isomerase-like protein (cupin superfamily)